jgi:hypothetical protein
VVVAPSGKAFLWNCQINQDCTDFSVHSLTVSENA